MLKLRKAEVLDTPSLMALIEDYKDALFDDYTEPNYGFVLDAVKRGEVYAIDDYGYPVGAIWLTNVFQDLHGTVHLLIRPESYKNLIKSAVLNDFIEIVFKQIGILQIDAELYEYQTGAIRVLKRYKFKQCGRRTNQTRKNGKRQDALLFELNRNFWEKSINGHVQQKERPSCRISSNAI